MTEVEPASFSSRPVVIRNRLGLHMRPAARFARLAGQFASEIRVAHVDLRVDGKSILGLATLVAECGTRLDVEARGPDAGAALAALVELVCAGFHELDECDL